MLLVLSWLFLSLVLCEEPPDPNSNKPPYRVPKWIAVGDSFSAGPGAGKEWNDGKDGRPGGGSGHCMRRRESYPPLLQDDVQMPGPDGPQSGKPLFQFVSCTGDTTVELLDTTIPNNQLEQIQDGTELVTLSIGGNDVFFGPILKPCILGVALKCKKRKEEGMTEMYSSDFHKRYNQVLTKIVQDKLRWNADSIGHTSLYVTSYLQFFDDWTDQCDSAKFTKVPLGPKITKELRQDINHMTHQLNEVLQYKIDLRNVDWTGYGWSSPGPEQLYTAVQFVDMDWTFLDHRFCRDGVVEPKDDPETWFYHLKIFGSNDQPEFDESQKDNETYVDQFIPMTWTPGKNGEPPFDENDPVQVENEETRTRTFHPKPDGYRAEAKNLINMLYEDTLQEGLAGKNMYFMCIGDITSLGEHRSFRSQTRFGYIPYLDKLLNNNGNFNGPLRHQFIGREGGQYAGDYLHEIYPWAKTLGDLAMSVAATPFLRNPILQGRMVIPIMVGAKDLMLGRKIDDILPELHWLLKEIWRQNPYAVVLLATLPMMGDLSDNGDEFWPLQRAVIEWNAKIAAMVNYYARKEKKPIVKVHMSTTQKEHIDSNIYIPNAYGYRRMAHDWLSGLVQANERNYFDGDRWKTEIPPFPSYDLEEIDEEVKKDMPAPICVQNRKIGEGDDGPKVEDITKSLFRDAKDRQDWVENYACNPEVQCLYSLDVESPNMEAEYPWGNGTTCVSAGGTNVYQTTSHQLIIRRESPQDDMGDWCVKNLNKLVEDCVEKSLFYGGYWAEGNKLINLTNLAWTDKFRNPSMNEIRNWNDVYGKYEEEVEKMKKGTTVPGDLKPVDLPG